jgi:hypothetical protein
MASKMTAAHDARQQLISITMAEKDQFTKPLYCAYCEAEVCFVKAHTRQVGDDIVAVEPFFRLNSGQKHSQSCHYNVHGQIAVIARESDADVIAAIQDNCYELRLLAVSKALEKLEELNNRKKYPSPNTSASKINKIYVDAGKERLGAYINSAQSVLKVRAQCEEHTEIEEVLQLVFDGTRLPWCDFYFEDHDYFRCFSQVTQATISIPIAIHGRVKTISIVKGSKNSFAVLNLVRPSRRTEYPDVLDMACFSVWSLDLDAFRSYREGQDIVAFGLWKSDGIKESQNKKTDADIKAFRNYGLRLWPVIKSQLCAVK